MIPPLYQRNARLRLASPTLTECLSPKFTQACTFTAQKVHSTRSVERAAIVSCAPLIFPEKACYAFCLQSDSLLGYASGAGASVMAGFARAGLRGPLGRALRLGADAGNPKHGYLAAYGVCG